MAEVLTDERVAVVLRPFVRATTPLLEVLRESDPLRLRGRFADAAAGAEAADVESAGAENEGTGNAGVGNAGAENEGAGNAGVGNAGAGNEGAENEGTEPDETSSTAPRTPAPDESPESGATTAEPSRGPDDSAEDAPGVLHKLLRQLDGMRLPGSSTWDAMSVDERCDWWAQRVGRLVAVVAGLPRFGGALTSRLPIRNALGMAGQGLVLSAIAAEHGVADRATRVRLIAKVLLDRDLPPEVASGERGGAQAEEDAMTAELTEELDEARRTGGTRVRAVVRTVWRMARALWEIDSELDKRPQGRFYHEWIGNVPVVGVVGGYLGERSALRRIAKQGAKWLRADAHGAGR